VPGDDEVAARRAANGGAQLAFFRIGVDLKLGAQGTAVAGEALAEDSVAVAVFLPPFPHHDEVAGSVTSDGGELLMSGGVGVALHLHAQRSAAGGKATRDDAIAVAVLTTALPRNHEVPARPGTDLWIPLGIGGEGIDLELGTRRSGRRDDAGRT